MVFRKQKLDVDRRLLLDYAKIVSEGDQSLFFCPSVVGESMLITTVSILLCHKAVCKEKENGLEFISVSITS